MGVPGVYLVLHILRESLNLSLPHSSTMPLIYRSKWSFSNTVYCQSVCGLEFSPDGSHLAYGSGGNLCILDVSSKQLVLVVRGRSLNKSLSSVAALTWLPKESFHLVCAFQDGIIANIARSPVSLILCLCHYGFYCCNRL